MSREIEATITKLRELLPYVAYDAKRLGNTTDLVRHSHDFHLASLAINETLAHPSLASLDRMPIIRVRIGSEAVRAYGMGKNPYDFIEPYDTEASPGEEYDLRYKHKVFTDAYVSSLTQPVYGQTKYFDLTTLANNLKNGGDLLVSEPGSSSSK